MSEWIEITTIMGCANNCVYCPQDVLLNIFFKINKTTDKKLSFDDFKNMLSKIPKRIKISFSGFAEPFVNEDTVKMLIFAHEQGFAVEVFSTLRGLDISDIKLMSTIPFVDFCVHIPDADGLMIYDIDDNYKEKLTLIKSRNFSNLRFLTIGRINKELNLLLGNKIGELPIISRGNNLKMFNLDKNIKVQDASIQRKGRKIVCNHRFYGKRKGCYSEVETPVLLPNGEMTLCCMDYGLKHVLGNLKNNTYDEIMNGSVIKRIRKSMKNQNDDFLLCRSCEWAKEYDLRKWKNFLKTGKYENAG